MENYIWVAIGGGVKHDGALLAIGVVVRGDLAIHFHGIFLIKCYWLSIIGFFATLTGPDGPCLSGPPHASLS